MSVSKIHYGVIEPSQLKNYELQGISVQFENGCTVFFEKDLFGKYCYGVDPLDNAKLFDSNNYLLKVIEWIDHWDVNSDQCMDELGQLLNFINDENTHIIKHSISA